MFKFVLSASKILSRSSKSCLENYVLLKQYAASSEKLQLRCYSSTASATSYSYSSKKSDEPLLGLTLGQLVDQCAERFQSREAIVVCHQNIRKSFVQLKEDADKLARGLLAIGLKPGNRVGIWTPNCYEWVLTQFAAAKAGMISVNINPALQAQELEYCINNVGIRAIVSATTHKTQKYYNLLSTVAPSLPKSSAGQLKDDRVPELTHVIMTSEEKYDGTYAFNNILTAGGGNETKELNRLKFIIQFDDPASIQFTSGTTGKPKGVVLTHHNLINNGNIIGRRVGYHLKPHKICIPVPLFHCFGCVAGSLTALIHGATAVYPQAGFSALANIEAVHKERCTSLYGTPTMFIDMLHLPDLNKYDLNSLSTGIMGGATCPVEVVLATRSILHAKDFISLYGSTETSPAISGCNPNDSPELKATTIGTVLDHTEVKLVDRDSLVVPCGAEGELWTRGYLVMKEYWGDEQKTKEAVTQDGWYKTGDLAVMDENGYMKIIGRIKDVLIRGGENIYPAEIEDFLHTHPDIAEIQVVGVPDKRMGEEVCAWIRLKPGKVLSVEDVKTFCKGKIAQFKIPRYIMFIEDFPKTASGKIQKFKLQEQSIKVIGAS